VASSAVALAVTIFSLAIAAEPAPSDAVAEGTLPSVATLRSLPLSVPSLTFEPSIASGVIFDVSTA
jgi:hypothetical protein